MNARLSHMLVTFISIISTFLSATLGGVSVEITADPVCPTGTNWDNGTQTCR